MLRRTDSAFSLIEAVVAIAVVAILAGMMAPLTLKVINQQREAKTREGLKAAFEGMFGSRERRVANMLADFGFVPAAGLTNLSPMVARPASGNWSAVPNYAQDGSGLFWGYNGPYWTGSSVGGAPVDAWGHTFRLKVTGASPGQTWQVYSFGTNGTDEGGAGDDLVYPTVPAVATAYTGILDLNVVNPSSRTGSVAVFARDGSGALVQVGSSTALAASMPTLVFNPAAGGTVIHVTVTGTGAANYYYLVDLLPGEVRDFSLSIP